MKKEKIKINHKVILNLIQDLQRLPWSFLNNLRGRSRIKYGMTSLFKTAGFTLIELLVVVLIIGILAAVALPQYQKAVEKSRMAEARTLIKSLQNATDMWVLEKGVKEGGAEEDQIWFTGKNSNAQLDIGLDSLDCNQENYFCLSRFFSYNVGCDEGGMCFVIAERLNPDGSHGRNGDSYQMYTYRSQGQDTWAQFCSWADTTKGKQACAILVASGWLDGGPVN